MTDDTTEPRAPLTRARVLAAAVALTDRDGLDALTMRALGAELAVSAMSLYKHVADKDAILDGIVERVLAEMAVPPVDADWQQAVRVRATSSREVLSRHSWAIGLIESRGTMGPAALRQVDAMLGCLRAAGFGIADAAHALWLLDGFVYGHVLQEAGVAAAASAAADGVDDPDPLTGSDDAAARALAGATPDEHPHLDELGSHAAAHPFEVGRAFEVGLELVVLALSTMLDASSG